MSDLPVPAQSAPPPAPPGDITYPVTELSLVLRACNPGKPLERQDPRRADLSELRHSAGVEPLRKRLTMQLEPGEYHHVLLCGHRGSGKSTELLELQQWADAQGFLAVRTEVNVRYGMIDLEYSDLFLLAAVVVEEAMERFGHPLPQDKLKSVVEWFAEVTHEDLKERKSEIGVELGAQLEAKTPFSIVKVFAKLTASAKGTSSHAVKTRETLRRYPDTLIALTKDLLETANRTLAAHSKPRGLLLLMDNLDRYPQDKIDDILVLSSQQMRQMACHALYTFPISLAYKPISGQVSKDYDGEVVLPMLALRPRLAPWADTVSGSEYDEDSVALLRGVLAKRVDLDALFVDPDDADLLVKMSGGAIRDLIRLVELAATFTKDERQITTEAVRSAINDLRGRFMRVLTTAPHDYRCLAAIAGRKSVVAEKADYGEQINRLLFNGCLLEYGEDGKPWHDVHPVLIETEEFRYACGARESP